MNKTMKNSEVPLASCPSSVDDIYFSSPNGTVVASGISQIINQPAEGGDDRSSLFQTVIRDAFEKEMEKGVTNPIIMGSIPFDLSKPSCLYVPKETQYFDEIPTHLFESEGAESAMNISTRHSEPCENNFKSAVNKAIHKFNTTALKKTVLSRILNVEFSHEISPKRVLGRLIEQNPTGFHFSVPQADGSILLGASPELLVQQEGNTVRSNPLAGSAKRQPTLALEKQVSEALLGSVKDLFEHKVVIDDIQSRLSSMCEQLNVPSSPSLLTTPTMWHLASPIDGQLKSNDINSLQLACLLHPTPAVCGHPFDLAKNSIEELEPFDRDMFAGMVGWCDSKGNGEWAVSIRCGRVQNHKVKLFAGAGIVKASCPQSEWQETEAKLRTMLSAFGLDARGSHEH